jgi:ElaB/YqjD/DUF883 family membrane-anchored ribosome-binding protein
MGQDPDAIRQDIEQTRAEMSDTVEAIGYKADVPSRAKEAVSDKVENVKAKVSDTATRAKEAVVGSASRAGDSVGDAASRVGDATPSRGEVRQTTRRAAGIARENPLGLAIGAAAVGFLAGLAVPSTRVEDEKLGPVADQVKDRVKETGQEALDRGRQVAREAAGAATDTARQSAQDHGEQLAGSAKESAQEAASEARRSSTSRLS